MKKFTLALISMFFILTASTNHIIATSGKLKKDSIVSCDGTSYGNHGDGHWHVATQHDSGWYPSGGSLGYDNPCASNLTEESPKRTDPPVQSKSNDTSLQSIMIESNAISILDTMRYTTFSESVLIDVAPTDTKTKITLNTNDSLQMGTNTRIITATAEDGTIKEYKLTIVREKIKSTDNYLKALTIGSTVIDINDAINYTTGDQAVSISAIANDENARIIGNGLNNLNIGNNKVILKVVAEDGAVKEYILNIKRLSDNIGLTVKINNTEIDFDSFKGKINVAHSVEELDIEYALDDKLSSAKISYDKKLKDGDNTVVIKVLAENGKTQEYEIVVSRNSLLIEIISILAVVAVVTIPSYYLIRFLRRKRAKVLST